MKTWRAPTPKAFNLPGIHGFGCLWPGRPRGCKGGVREGSFPAPSQLLGCVVPTHRIGTGFQPDPAGLHGPDLGIGSNRAHSLHLPSWLESFIFIVVLLCHDCLLLTLDSNLSCVRAAYMDPQCAGSAYIRICFFNSFQWKVHSLEFYVKFILGSCVFPKFM